ncbi:MAG: peroxiredoxin [Boseongicola sp. SB0662_bin_57]|nr:peroxiredoxin [Boseongicola sp. SB0662_bin_57]
MNQKILEAVDWQAIPAPADDGSASHLEGMSVPSVPLPSTRGGQVNPGHLRGWSVLFFYPMTGRPDVPLPDGWDDIPGARGCTPQSCAFRDLSQELADKGVSAVFGISTQSTEYQREAADRLHLPFALLSDAELQLTAALRLPTMEVEGNLLLKRLTLVLHGAQVKRVFFPVFPPDRNAADVLKFMESSLP